MEEINNELSGYLLDDIKNEFKQKFTYEWLKNDVKDKLIDRIVSKLFHDHYTARDFDDAIIDKVLERVDDAYIKDLLLSSLLKGGR